MARAAVVLAWFAAGCGGFVPVDGADAGAPDAGSGGVVVLAASRAGSADLAVGGGYVYWVDEGTASHAGHDGKVMRVPVDGCAQGDAACPTVLADQRNAPGAIVLSLDGTLLFWSELEDKTGDLTGGAIFALPLGGNAISQLAMGQDGPQKLAVDDAALYWIDNGSNEVRRQFIDQGTPNGLPIAMLESPTGLAVDPGAGRVYVTSFGSDGTDGVVRASDLDGTGAVVVAMNAHGARGIAVGPSYVYWGDTSDGTVMHAHPDGSDFGATISNRATPNAVALDATRIYWTEAGSAPYFTDGRVATCRFDGSDLRILADHRVYPRSLAVDDNAVYWVDRGTAGGDMYDGALAKVEKPPAQ